MQGSAGACRTGRGGGAAAGAFARTAQGAGKSPIRQDRTVPARHAGGREHLADIDRGRAIGGQSLEQMQVLIENVLKADAAKYVFGTPPKRDELVTELPR